MAGIQNEIIFSQGERLLTSTPEDILEMQNLVTDISRINYSGNPEGNVAANPSSLCHDPTTGNFYIKLTGTGNTGWALHTLQSPNSILQFYDDFLYNSFSGKRGQLGWLTSSSADPTTTDSNLRIVTGKQN